MIAKAEATSEQAVFFDIRGWHSREEVICRVKVQAVADGFEASALRAPSVAKHATSRDEAIRAVIEAYREARAANRLGQLTPIQDIEYEEFMSAVGECVFTRSPELADIDSAFDDQMTADQLSDLALHRASNAARPTVPLARLPRP